MPAMRYRLDLTLRQAEGALSRVLGTAERRGFRPLAVEGEARAEGDRWHLQMTVEGERAVDLLQQQLTKLYDCLDVQVQPCP
jgi:acetolactate synthase II small subunit